MHIKKEYEKELAIAKANYADLKERGTDAIGEDAIEFMNSLMTADEIAASNLRVAILGELIMSRNNGIDYKKLEKLSGVKQSVIKRIEKGTTSPQIDTVLKLLAPLGKTLAVVPLENN